VIKTKEPELNYEIRMMKISELKFDIGNYQRKASYAKVKNIIRSFDWKAFGFIIVNIRDSGNYVIDGQHRIVAATRKSYKEVPCMVYSGLALSEEAGLFVNCQINRNAIHAFEKYQALLVSGDHTTTRIEFLLQKHGLKSSRGHSDSSTKKRGYTNAIGALYSIYNSKGYDKLDKLLGIMVSTWKYDDGTFDPDALSNTMLYGMNVFMNKTFGKINEKKFIAKFRKIPAGKIISMSKKNQAVYGKGIPSNVARAILEEYNFRNSNKLDIVFN
jgi:hypothetical protein